MTDDQERLGQLLANRRWCYFVPTDGFIEGKGFRVSVVIEGEDGHYPTGDLDTYATNRNHKEPWFWGMTYREAEQVCAERNADTLKLSEADVAKIVMSSMAAKPRKGTKRRGAL